ncbi:hypothetical protein FB567DRAFT_449769 [Paraphoma chrysanthemicola]|uniref:Uncharacterized protein n=1 Tax=Paraphoma chrysanthemicola TaxID=798071 RepID=A0A8K0R120_9PLEO|nr:hypothetical protein FB567DRAFT_449769 [Paraphoma chrysanthemicola]
MLILSIYVLALCLRHAAALALSATTTTTSISVASLVRRATIPTITFGPKEDYFPEKPNKSTLQIYPTGSYDDFPEDGIVVAVGEDLRKQIQDTIAQSCKRDTPSQECHDALMPILHNTDLGTHTKRFVVIGGVMVISIVVAVVAIVYEMGHIANTDVPTHIKLNHADLAQIQSMSGASTIAAVGAEASASPYTIVVQPSATPTAQDTITIETLQASRDNHKAGDVLYRIPANTSQRILDFLGMTGLAEAQDKCQGVKTKRVDNVQECLRSIERLAVNLADGGPDNLLQVAQQNMPANPGAGQPIAAAIPNLAIDGIPLVIPVYRVMYEHGPRRPNFDMGWSPAILATSGLAVAIVYNWATAKPQTLTEIWIDGEKVMSDLTDQKLACPKDLFCIKDNCAGQEREKNWVGPDPYCKKVETFACRCRPVTYGHVYDVEWDYMDKQYEWLEELIKRANEPPLESKCEKGEKEMTDPLTKFKA